jgi:glycosyltransferase involved in cell wall biosynthesis
VAEWARQTPRVTYLGELSRPDFAEMLRKSDVLLLPFNSDATSLQYCRLSWPTKLNEYLASGSPVLHVGPRGTAVHDYLTRKSVGYCIVPELGTEAAFAVVEELRSEEARLVVGERGRESVALDFSREHRDRNFRRSVRSAVRHA